MTIRCSSLSFLSLLVASSLLGHSENELYESVEVASEGEISSPFQIIEMFEFTSDDLIAANVSTFQDLIAMIVEETREPMIELYEKKYSNREHEHASSQEPANRKERYSLKYSNDASVGTDDGLTVCGPMLDVESLKRQWMLVVDSRYVNPFKNVDEDNHETQIDSLNIEESLELSFEDLRVVQVHCDCGNGDIFPELFGYPLMIRFVLQDTVDSDTDNVDETSESDLGEFEDQSP